MNYSKIVEIQEQAVKYAAAAGNNHPALTVNYYTGIDDSEYIKERKNTPDSACCIYDSRNKKGINQQLKISLPMEIFPGG
jgi:hypothetical protein